MLAQKAITVTVQRLVALSLCVSPLFFGATSVQALDLSLGLAGVEEGHEVLRPAVAASFATEDGYYGGALYYGRQFSSVVEKTYLLTSGSAWSVMRSKTLFAKVGLSLLDEYTGIYTKGADAYPATDKNGETSETTPISEHHYNAGIDLGLSWTPLRAFGACLTFGWDSHLFLAGLERGIQLSTARKQVLSISLGGDL